MILLSSTCLALSFLTRMPARELTVRDLLCHRSGLERGDLLWYGSDLSRDEILRRVRYLKPTWSFRATFGYQNLMFLAAGQIIPSITGKSWDDFLKERIFTPLGYDGFQHQYQRPCEVKQRRSASRQNRREGRSNSVAQHRQHRTCGLDQFKRRRPGAVGAASARRRKVPGQSN